MPWLSFVNAESWRKAGKKQAYYKLLPEPVSTYCQMDPWDQISVKVESKYKEFLFYFIF